jgi:hypothetical protein
MAHKMYRSWAHLIIAFVIGSAALLQAAPVRVADNLLIEGYYTQEGQSISRGQLEKFLLNQPNEISNFADKSKAYRLSSFAVGGPMWLISTGVTLWQALKFVKLMDTINMNSSSNTSPVIYQNCWKISVPIIIGGELSAFIQGRLRNHSNYLLHKAVKSYDSILCTKQQVNIIIDHQIKEMKPGWFLQDRVLMPTTVLYSVLKEKKESYGAANSSLLCKELAINAGLIGSIFLTNSIIAFFEGGIGDKNVNIKQRNTQLGLGIGLELIATISSVISAGIRDKAIQKYNETMPKMAPPLQLFDPIPTEPVNYPSH